MSGLWKKLKIKSSLKEATKVAVKIIDAYAVPSATETACLKKIKPRAIIFKANQKDFRKLKDSIETEFPEVEIIYVTTGPVASILRVTKSIPFEMQNSSTQPYYTVE